jgi:hypothetical protein
VFFGCWVWLLYQTAVVAFLILCFNWTLAKAMAFVAPLSFDTSIDSPSVPPVGWVWGLALFLNATYLRHRRPSTLLNSALRVIMFGISYILKVTSRIVLGC